MTVGSAAARIRWKNAVRMSLSLFRSPFNSSKCKTMAKMAVARVKLLRNKRQVVVKQMRRDIAMLLESRQDATARIRVEHVIREQNIMAANELIELFCELVVTRLSIIAKQRECPADLKEGISSLIFAAPRCSDIPELLSIRDVFQRKYGKDFVSAATDLRPNAGVNRMLIEKLSVKNPSGEIKLKVLKEIAKEYQVEWDTTESEMELLKPPEERIDGPTSFVSATSLPLKPAEKQSPASNKSTNSGVSNIKNYEDLASAAGDAAEKAMAAAEAAALLAYGSRQMSGSRRSMNHDTVKGIPDNSAYGQSWSDQSDDRTKTKKNIRDDYSHWGNMQEKDATKVIRRQSYNCTRAHSDIKFDESDCDEELEMEAPPPRFIRQSSNRSSAHEEMNRRHSYNIPPAQPDIRYDESDSDDSGDMDERNNHRTFLPPERPAPQVPVRRVHPKLPDYDALAARFEALKHHQRSQT